MLIDGSNLIPISTTALSAFALPISIFLIFFEVTPGKRIQLSRLQMVFAIMWLLALIVGIVNLFMFNGKDHGSSIGQDNSIQDGYVQGSDNQNTDFSPEEFVEQNFDLIRQLKAEYSNEDTQIIEDKKGIAQFCICEKAGYVYRNSMKTGEYGILCGEKIPTANVIIIDYLSDEIINTFTSKKDGVVSYYPDNQNQFYLVIFHDEYDVYVSPPFQVISRKADSNFSYICLEAKSSQYTPLYQFHLYMKNFGTDEPYIVVPSDYCIKVYCKNASNYQSVLLNYQVETSDSGLLLWGDNKSYFSFNTDYVLGIKLWHESDPNLQAVLNMFDGSIKESNQINLYFEFPNKSDTIE